MIGLDQTATIYTPDTDGEFTVVDTSGLAVRLALVNSDTAPTAADRDELASRRLLLWGPDYQMPATAQIEVDGVRWNVVAGTLGQARGLGGAVVYQRADVVRVS